MGALGLTAILLLWHLPFAPFSTPGAKANEAVFVFLIAMALRWVILAGLVVSVARGWASRLSLRGLPRAGLVIGTLTLHLLLGLLNLGVWNAWLSRYPEHTPRGDSLLAAAYFSIPSLMLAALASFAWPLLQGSLLGREKNAR
jgi:hypothetical protein